MSGQTYLPYRFPVACCDSRGLFVCKIGLTLCLLLFSLLMSPGLQAWQKYIRFDRITAEDGLPGTFVRSIVQDNLGFMWFATNNGLARYDGYRIIVYQHDIDDPESVSSNEVLSVFEDHLGILWVGTDAGLDRFDRSQETFTHFTHNPDDASSLGGPVVPTIYEDREGVLWIGHWFAGLSKFDRATERFVNYKHDPNDATSLPNGNVFAILEDRSGDFWVGTNAREGSPDLTRFDRESGTFTRFFTCKPEEPRCPRPAAESDRPPISKVLSIFEDKTGTIWVGGYGLTRYDRSSNIYKQYFHDPENPNSLVGNDLARNMVEDDNGLLWFPDTYKGLTSFNPKTGSFNNYRHDPADPDSIGADILFNIYQDRSGLIWVASYYNGLSKFDPRSLAFGRYQHVSNDPSSLSSTQNISDIVEDKNGLLWVGFQDVGLNRIDRASGSVSVFQNDPNTPGSLHTNNINDLYVAGSGDLWIGTTRGLSHFDPVTGMFEVRPFLSSAGDTDEPGSNSIGVLSIIEDRDGLLWLATSTAIHHYDPATGSATHYLANPDQPEGLHGDLLRISFITDDGAVWIKSQSAGINVFNPVTATFTHYVHDPDNPDSLPQGPVMDIWQDQNGVIWVGTQSGLGQLDPQSGVYRLYRGNGDFPKGRVNKVLPDGRGNLLIATSFDGLWKLDPVSGTFKKYDVNDGLVCGGLEPGLLSQSGELIFADETGIYIFNPDDLPDRLQPPGVVFTDFLLLNKSVPVSHSRQATPLSTNINETNSITLTHKDYLFAFEFAAPNYINAMATSYAYKLQGVDEDWIETDASKRFATYTMVPPGQHVLKVRASNPDGGWSDQISSIQLTILPPWWQTWWAYSLYVIAIVFALFVYIRLRTIGLTRRARVLEKTVEERTAQIREKEEHIRHQAEHLEELLHLKEKLIANISHEFRTPLTLIQGPARSLIRSSDNPESLSKLQMIKRNSERLLRLVDQLLGLARLGADEPQTQSVQPLTTVARIITESFQVLAEEKDLQLSMQAGDEVWVSCPADALEKILLNLLSNAIKYTPPGGRITVSTTLNENDGVELSVADTGVGIAEKDQQAIFERFHRIDDSGEAVPGAGIGLALVKELVEANDGKIDLHSRAGEGTRITVTLPRSKLAPVAEEDGRVAVNQEAIALEVASLKRPSDAARRQVIDEGVDDKPRILVVEDNVDMQSYLVELLSENYQCDVAGDGQQAVETAFEYIPDLVLCDVMLPKMDGFQVSHTLRNDERTSHIPIMMLTARSDRDSRMEGWKEHVDDYLTKPFDDEELKLRISNLLDIRDILKSRFSSQFFEQTTPGQTLTKGENGFIEKLERVLDQHHADPEFGLSQMASEMFVSPRQLQRKLKAVTGHSPAEFLRSYRLRKARDLLRSGKQVALAADAVGFSTPNYFTNCFKAQFGHTPTEYQQQFH